jgi:hypothetical protein
MKCQSTQYKVSPLIDIQEINSKHFLSLHLHLSSFIFGFSRYFINVHPNLFRFYLSTISSYLTFDLHTIRTSKLFSEIKNCYIKETSYVSF